MKAILLIALIGAVIVSGCTTSQETYLSSHQDSLQSFEISPAQLSQKMKEGGIKLLDVREDFEYEESHLEGTQILSVDKLTQENLDSLGLDKTDEIIVYCRSGRRSERAYYILETLGYENVKSLGGGIVHWEEDGYPVVKGTSLTSPSGTLTLDRKEHDFGEIPQYGGTVSTQFTLTNSGETEITIETITTSCSCTTASLDKEILSPGESSILSVTFDPNFHEEPLDRFKRTVFIDTGSEEIEAIVWVDILEGI